jgi:hypothetical protein
LLRGRAYDCVVVAAFRSAQETDEAARHPDDLRTLVPVVDTGYATASDGTGFGLNIAAEIATANG